MKEHTHLHPYCGTCFKELCSMELCSLSGYHYYDTVSSALYIKIKKFFIVIPSIP
jgi:hypothetical protein